MRRAALGATAWALALAVTPPAAAVPNHDRPPAPGPPAATPSRQPGTTTSGTIPNGSYTVSLRGGVLAVGVSGGEGAPRSARPGLPAAGSACAGGATYRYEVAGDDEARRLRRQWRVAHSGTFLRLTCGDETVAPLFRPASAGPGAGPAGLYDRDRHDRELSSPLVHTSPARDQLVQVPTWLWLDPSAVAPRDAGASLAPAVGGQTVTATATASRVVWSTGDGAVRTCAPDAPAYDPDRPPAAQSTPCSHIYRRSSARAPDEVFEGVATVYFQVRVFVDGALDRSFTSAGLSLPFARRVAEGQALGTGVGP